MKKLLFGVMLMASISTYAKSYSFEGTSSIDGELCKLSFVLDEDNSMTNLHMEGALKINSILEEEEKIKPGAIEDSYFNELFTLKKGSSSSAWVANKKLAESGYNNKLGLTFRGESLDNLQSMQLNSNVRVLLLSIGKVSFDCQDLKAL